MFDTANYLVELNVTEDSKANGLTLQQLRDELDETIPVLAVVREDNRRAGYQFHGVLREGDILLLEAGPDELKLLEDKVGLSAIAEPEEPEDGRSSARTRRRAMNVSRSIPKAYSSLKLLFAMIR